MVAHLEQHVFHFYIHLLFIPRKATSDHKWIASSGVCFHMGIYSKITKDTIESDCELMLLGPLYVKVQYSEYTDRKNVSMNNYVNSFIRLFFPGMV